MTTHRPKVQPDSLYNQGQTAKALKVDRHTVARYEQEGLIKFESVRGRKRTTGAEIIRLWQGIWGDDD